VLSEQELPGSYSTGPPELQCQSRSEALSSASNTQAASINSTAISAVVALSSFTGVRNSSPVSPSPSRRVRPNRAQEEAANAPSGISVEGFHRLKHFLCSLIWTVVLACVFPFSLWCLVRQMFIGFGDVAGAGALLLGAVQSQEELQLSSDEFRFAGRQS
jgi:hypothetical protein